jgi:dihydrofolate synthase / folylpolyglutamate synthase
VVEQISKQSFRQLFMVWGMVKDKNRQSILSLLPSGARYIFCQASIPRALDAEILLKEAKACGLSGTVVHSVHNAIELAKSEAQPDDMIFIGGSTFVVAEVERLKN